MRRTAGGGKCERAWVVVVAGIKKEEEEGRTRTRSKDEKGREKEDVDGTEAG